ncbi:hypothetical protein [Planctomicrobium sp. SH527]|uniref:hypothetical protein n=1 Tax=Planctomicrobium sp. SH527 TaxID=3448123 RepID=UPI003F5B8A79
MKRTIPLLITAFSGLMLIISTFVPAMQSAGEEVTIWFDILAAIAFVLGGGNLLKLHLQQISDQKPGWAYSVITLVSFLGMLIFGMLKFGSPPEASQEFYGKSAVPIELESLPEFRIPGTLPQREDGAALPKSAALQIYQDGSEIAFRGWMTEEQAADLQSYVDRQEWKCEIERLHDLAQPPQQLAGRISYLPNHRLLLFAGVMTAADQNLVVELLAPSEQVTQQVKFLYEQSNRVTRYPLQFIPDGLAIPNSANQEIELDGTTLVIHGPLSTATRDALAGPWANQPMSRPLTDAARNRLLEEILQAGTLTEKQRTAFNTFFAADKTADQFIDVVNIAGISPARTRTACELLSDLNAGVMDPPLSDPPPSPQRLNQNQEQEIRNYIDSETMSGAELTAAMAAAGPMSPAQFNTVTSYLAQQPTLADQRRELCFRLLSEDPLTKQQTDLLLTPAREQFRWKQTIGHAFLTAHQTKYAWSGSYTAQGTPFWWIYEYALQPLMTTTFALLAFYVASAAYRAFRAKNLEATLLLGTAFLILLGRTSAGPALTSWLPDSLSFLKMDSLMDFIMSVFNTAGNRAIMIGIALGTISMSLRVLLGIDRSYLGSGKE